MVMRMVFFMVFLKLKFCLGLCKQNLGFQVIVIFILYLEQRGFLLFKSIALSLFLILFELQIGSILRNTANDKVNSDIVKIWISVFNSGCLLLR
jgi:hypothetical protein